MSDGFSIPQAKGASLNDLVGQFLAAVRTSADFEGLYKYAKARQEQIEQFLAPGKSAAPAFPELVVLRKWNSYTPLLPPSREDYLNKGGGYFLRVADKGIVIDPGFNFIESFLKAGFKIDDIDHVLISHAHNDHTVELEGLFSLLYKRNKRAKVAGLAPKQVTLYMNLGAFKKFSGYFDLSQPGDEGYVRDIVLLNRHQYCAIMPGVSLLTTQAQHHELITANYALGFILRVAYGDSNACVIRFTCDTGWNTKVEVGNREQAEEFQMDGIDVLVAHIGSLRASELNYDAVAGLDAPENVDALYKHHLGLIGSVASIHFWKPKLVLLSEFGEEMSDVRISVAQQLADRLHVPVIPTDLNFRVNLETRGVFCFRSRDYFEPRQITVYAKDGSLYPIGNASTVQHEVDALRDRLNREIKVFS
jgi:hypothetical protein